MDRLKTLGQVSSTAATALSVVAAQQTAAALHSPTLPSWFPAASALMVFAVVSQISRLLFGVCDRHVRSPLQR